ncbi:phosphopantetheine-binding protein [Pedobacter sp. NJ-S-72]
MLTFLGQHVPLNNGLSNPQPVLAQSIPQATHYAPAPVAQPVLQQPVATAVKAVAEQKDVKLALLQIVSDKTGYPQEMLGMEMDLEADLSIDSIKRLEIIGALRTELGGFSSTHSEDTVMEQLAGIKTLNGLVNWITENAVPAGTNISTTINIEVTVNNNNQQLKFSTEELRAAILSVVSEKKQDILKKCWVWILTLKQT